MEKRKGFVDRKKLNLDVKRDFQRWLLLKLMTTVIVSSLIAACILYFYARQEVIDSYFDAHIRLRRVSDLLLPVIAVGSAVSLLAGGYLALFLPQKIAGPIYRIEKGLREVAEGDLTTEVTLRDDDTLKDLAVNVSSTIASLRGHVLPVKEGQLALEDAAKAGDKDKMVKLIEQQRILLDKLKT